MLRKRLMVIASVAAAMGLVSALFLLRVIKAQGATADRFGEATGVVTARIELAVGTVLTADHVEVVRWPSGAVPVGTFTSREEVTGRVARSHMLVGEPVILSRLAPVGSRGGLPVLIPDGMRAISVAVNDVVGVAGFIQPACRVDVVATVRDSSHQPVTRVILQNILVLAVAGEVEPSKKSRQNATAITLAVEPAQAEKLSLAINEGKIHLVLRNFVDTVALATPGTTPDELFRVARLGRSTEPAQAPEALSVEVFRGLERSEVRLELY